MKFTHAIVRAPGQTYANGETHGRLGKPNLELALQQHQNYVQILKDLGLNVIELPICDHLPDSTFVEDVALVTQNGAIITRPGADSRREEIEFIKESIQENFETIFQIEAPGTLDAGDIMMVGDHFYIGISARTNIEGADQCIRYLEEMGYTGEKVPLSNVLHLKTGISYLENDNLLVSGEFVGHPTFSKFRTHVISLENAYSANSLWINDSVIVPKGFPSTTNLIAELGYNVIEINVSEYEKQDGGLSCLSLRW